MRGRIAGHNGSARRRRRVSREHRFYAGIAEQSHQSDASNHDTPNAKDGASVEGPQK
jgi:hypothetical protein